MNKQAEIIEFTFYIMYFYHAWIFKIQGGAKVGLQLWVRETQCLFLCYYLLVIVSFSIWATINLLLPYPVIIYYLCDQIKMYDIWKSYMINILEDT